jgi:hypothetical protein
VSGAAVRRSVPAIEAETAAGDEPVAVLLDGLTVHVKPVKQWRSSGLRALREGDFQTWAEKCLEPESVDVWLDLDPTIGDVESFFEQWQELSGQSAGKSPVSPRSSKTTRMR